jgi:serine/threonine protein kinase
MKSPENATCDECGKLMRDCVCASGYVAEICESCGKLSDVCRCGYTTGNPDGSREPGDTADDTDRDSSQEYQFNTQRIQSNLDKGIESIIDAKFRIIGELGSGADSTVYLAEHLYLQKKVSLKLFKPVDFESNRFARIQREAVTLANLKHPNIVGVTDLGVMGSGIPYIVQEYIEGKDFQAFIKDRGPLTETMAFNLFCQIASGIAFLHDSNIIHRDIKPSNIIISNTAGGAESAKLIDLGIAKPDNPGGAVTFATTSGNIFGSPFYMSPEQCRGEELDWRTDIYSFGCVMYEALTGSPPFRGQTMLVTLDKHVTEDAAPLNQRRKGLEPVSKELEALVGKCLSKKPGDRYHDMKQVYNALHAAQSKKARIAKTTAIIVCSLVFVLCLSFLIRNQAVAPETAAVKKKNDALKIIDKLAQARSIEIATSTKDTVKAYREAYEEGLRQKAPPLSQLQLGADLFYIYHVTDDSIAGKKLFDDLQYPLKEVEKKLKKEPDSFPGKSLDCLYRIYYFAGNFATTEKREQEAESDFLTALKYADLCNERRAIPTVWPALIKSSLATVYHLERRARDAEKSALESTELLLKSDAANPRALLNNAVILTEIQVDKEDYKSAAAYLKQAWFYKRASGVHEHDETLKKLTNTIREKIGEAEFERVTGMSMFGRMHGGTARGAFHEQMEELRR